MNVVPALVPTPLTPAPLTPAPLTPTPVPMFERHNTCLTCGYDLYGQPKSGTCPECGTSTRESARHEAYLAQPGNVARLRGGAALLLWSAILSGCCPGVCLIFVSNNDNIYVAMLMSLVFVATAVTTYLGEQRFDAMRESPDRRSILPDALAGVGLLSVNLAAYAMVYHQAISTNDDTVLSILIGLGFVLLCATAWRAVPAYRLRREIADACLGTHRRGFIGLGYTKAIFETAWFCCCFLPPLFLLAKYEDGGLFFGIAALIGLGGFALIWIAMIAVHLVLFAKVRKYAGLPPARGFEVQTLTAPPLTPPAGG